MYLAASAVPPEGNLPAGRPSIGTELRTSADEPLRLSVLVVPLDVGKQHQIRIRNHVVMTMIKTNM